MYPGRTIEHAELRKHFFLILLVIFLFNSPTVFYFEEYISDDILWYSAVILDKFLPSDRNPLSLHFEWPMWQLMVASPKLTHLLYILLYMTPVSFLSYYIYRKYLGINTIVSFAAALLPHVSANLSNFPAYTNGSYIIYQLLIGLAAVVTGLWSVEKSNRYYLFASILLFCLLSLLTEFTVFVSLPFVLIFFLSCGFRGETFILAASYTAVALYKLYSVRTIGSDATAINGISLETVIYRAKMGFMWLFPVQAKVLGGGFGWLAGGLILLLVSSLLISFFRQRDEHSIFDGENYAGSVSGKAYILIFYAFCFVWLGTVFPFTLVSHWFTPRYFYLAAFPFSLLLTCSLFTVAGSIFRYNKMVLILFFIFIVVVAGYGRAMTYYTSQEKDIMWGMVYNQLFADIDLPLNSQIYIVDEKRHHNGVWFYNRSYIQFHAKRPDVIGHIGDDNYNYRNPFLGKREFAQSPLEGLKLVPPLFMYRINREDGTFTQYNYFLKWDVASKDSTWAIYDLDRKTGDFALVGNGRGWARYLQALARLGLEDMRGHDVAFGGCPSDEAIQRLGLTREEIILLKGCGKSD